MPANPSPMGTPQRRAAEAHQSQVCTFADYFPLHLYFWLWKFEVSLTDALTLSSDAPDAVDMWRHHHARADREETHTLHGNSLQTTPTSAESSGKASTRQEWRQASGAESVQTRKHICPPRLGENQRGQKDPSSPIPYTENRVLGHSHLTVTTHLAPPYCTTQIYSLPHSSGLYWLSPAHQGHQNSSLRAPGGLYSLMSKDNGGYHSNIYARSGCHVFLSSLVIFDIFLFPVTGFL